MKELRRIHYLQLGDILTCILLLVFILFILDCSSARKKTYGKELRLGTPAIVKPDIIHSGTAQACESCMKGNYNHSYTIEAGIHAGDVYLCCVPIEELARESFNCSCKNLLYLGTPLDQKVTTCLVIDGLSPEPRYIRVCIPAPLSAPTSVIDSSLLRIGLK